MAKFKIPVEKLPPPNINGDHLIRFRVSTEDRNSISEWSKLFSIPSVGQIHPLESEYTISASTNLVSVYWDTPSIYNTGASAIGASVLHNHESEWKQHDSDIFVKFDDLTTEYFVYWGRSSDNSFSIVPYFGATSVRVIVQVASHPPTLLNKFKILDTGIVSLV
jgi:hypothetical protein